MKEKAHGIISLFIFSGTIIIGFVGINKFSIKFALIYLLITVISFLTIVYSYCTKCMCHKNNCMHLIPGLITKILPERKDGKYLLKDYAGVFIPFVFIISIPQYWLINNKILFLIYWILFIMALIEIIAFVCRKCENYYCYLCKNKSIK